ncbi:MAG: NAD(P)H-hydrate dehydratase, partial [Desulfurococcales archaeon]|nr:NAD(P)H-hydrate dehydratase [Desulfurococcales archaeon]
LSLAGARVRVHLAYSPHTIAHKAAARNYGLLKSMDDVEVIEPHGNGWLELGDSDIVVDALLGMGVRGALRSPIREAVEAINKSPALKVSIDTPTGLDPDTGEVSGTAVKADVTVSLHAPKRGLLSEKSRAHVGRLVVADIGIPLNALDEAGPGDYVARVPDRPRDAHKGVGGRVLIVAGSRDYIGAPILAAAAASVIADLVYLLSTREAAYAAASRVSSVIPRVFNDGRFSRRDLATIEALLDRVHSIVVGPGISRDEEIMEAVAELMDRVRGKPTVLDADALSIVAETGGLWEEAVITPHRGEIRSIGRALGVSAEKPLESTRLIASRLGCVVALKGPTDFVCDPRGKCRYNRRGAPSMSVGGTGDLLVGLIASIMARRAALGLDPDPLNSAAVALYVNGRAGELADREYGGAVTAYSISELLPKAIYEARELSQKIAEG